MYVYLLIKYKFQSKNYLFQAWLGDLKTKSNDQGFVFRNKEWNAQSASGSQFNFEFVAHGVVSNNIITVLLNGQSIDLNSDIVTPSESTISSTGSTLTFETKSFSSTTSISPKIDSKYNYKGVLHASLLFL